MAGLGDVDLTCTGHLLKQQSWRPGGELDSRRLLKTLWLKDERTKDEVGGKEKSVLRSQNSKSGLCLLAVTPWEIGLC